MAKTDGTVQAMWLQSLLSAGWNPGHILTRPKLEPGEEHEAICFARGSGDPALFPAAALSRALRFVLRRDGAGALDYGDGRGYLPLRIAVATHLARQGVQVTAEEVLITSGSQQAIDLCAQAFLQPGDWVVVESPTYNLAIDLFLSHKVNLAPVPVDEEGMRVDGLEAVVATRRPRLIYVIPTNHNPTGACMGAHRRKAILDLARQHSLPLLEDNYLGDLVYGEGNPPPLKAMDARGDAVMVGTFSKTLAPALRVGYLVAERALVERLARLRVVRDVSGCEVMQRVMELLLSTGWYRRHVMRLRREYRARRDTMGQALRRQLPGTAGWDLPRGGLFFWLRLPAGVEESDVVEKARQAGVSVAGGSFFFPEAVTQGYLRLNLAENPPERIEEGVRRLALAMASSLSGREARSAPPRAVDDRGQGLCA